MNERTIRDERPTMSGGQSLLEGLTSITARGEMTDNVYQEDARDPRIEVDEEPQAYDGDVMRNEAYSSSSLREVNIRPLSSGYLVNVGCQSVAVETTETLLKTLGEYLNNPTGFERDWNKNPNRSKL
jgi:hypothetical protein